MLAALSRRLVLLTRRVMEVSGLSVERRLARVFVGLADGCGRAAPHAAVGHSGSTSRVPRFV